MKPACSVFQSHTIKFLKLILQEILVVFNH